jgi:hypothetical protein
LCEVIGVTIAGKEERHNREDTVRRWTSASLGVRAEEKPALPTP